MNKMKCWVLIIKSISFRWMAVSFFCFVFFKKPSPVWLCMSFEMIYDVFHHVSLCVPTWDGWIVMLAWTFCCHTQVGALPLQARRNSCRSRTRLERAAWETTAIWWRYGGVAGSGSVPLRDPHCCWRSTQAHLRPSSSSGFSRAALSPPIAAKAFEWHP